MACCKGCQGYATLCRVFTYGWLIASVVLSCFAVASCEFVTRNDLTIGLYSFSRGGGECMEYSDINGYTTGWLHTWAQVSGALAPIFGFLAIALMVVDCCSDICCSKYMQTGLVVCCQINQGFTFLIWVSDSCLTRKGSDGNNSTTIINRGCRIGDGSIFSFTAFILFIISGFFLCCNPKPDPLCCKKDTDEDRQKGCWGKGGKEKEPAVDEQKSEKENEKEKEKDVEDENNAKAVADEETPNNEDATDENAGPVEDEAQAEEKADENEKEAPAAVPVPIPVPKSQTPPPPDSGMEVELDEEFGTSQVRY